MSRPTVRHSSLLRETWSRFRASGDTHSAATAFYALLSVAPLIVIMVDVAAVAFDDGAARAGIARGLRRVATPDVVQVVERMLDASILHRSGLFARVIATLLALLAASRLFVQVHVSLNEIWGVRVPETQTFGEYLRYFAIKRALSLAMVLACGLLLLVELVLQTALSGLGSLAADLLGAAVPAPVVLAEQTAVSLVIRWLLFALVYRVLPDARVHWADVVLGAALTVLLTLPGTWLLGLYFAHVAPTFLQGAVGSAALFILWTYYMAQVFFFGAAFTRAWSCRHGEAVQPGGHAELAGGEGRV